MKLYNHVQECVPKINVNYEGQHPSTYYRTSPSKSGLDRRCTLLVFLLQILLGATIAQIRHNQLFVSMSFLVSALVLLFFSGHEGKKICYSCLHPTLHLEW